MLGLKKQNCIAWLEVPDREYENHIIRAKIRLDSLGGYASAGILFHIMDEESYYMVLVSSKGYFRVDVVKDQKPKTLIAWTEVSDFDGTNIDLDIITYGTYKIFIINDKWAGETSDDSIGFGQVGFALASYESPTDSSKIDAPQENEYTCKAFLDYFSVDTRVKTIEENFKKWNDGSNINAESLLRLAETFAVTGDSLKALEYINRAWERRYEAIKAFTSDIAEVRTKKELLLAARMSFRLEQYNEAEEFIDAVLEQWRDSAEGKEAAGEKIKILNELDKFAELKEFVIKYPDILNDDIDSHTIMARCYWGLKEYEKSAAEWDKAFKLNSDNGIYAANAANALELAEKKEEALERFLTAGKIFMQQDNNAELAVMMPKLAALGAKSYEGRTLIGKWAFGIGDYDRSEAELTAAEKLRKAEKPRPKADPALCYLLGLIKNMKGKNKEAIRLLETAVKLAPDYGLFRFKLAEFKLTGGIKGTGFTAASLAKEFKLALKDMDSDDDGSLADHAGALLLKAGDKKNANYFFSLAEKKRSESDASD